MNDTERADWVQNNAVLYEMWQQSKQGLTTFVRKNRKEIDEVIQSVYNGGK